MGRRLKEAEGVFSWYHCLDDCEYADVKPWKDWIHYLEDNGTDMLVRRLKSQLHICQNTLSEMILTNAKE
jgi:hypothetical protein